MARSEEKDEFYQLVSESLSTIPSGVASPKIGRGQNI